MIYPLLRKFKTARSPITGRSKTQTGSASHLQNPQIKISVNPNSWFTRLHDASKRTTRFSQDSAYLMIKQSRSEVRRNFYSVREQQKDGTNCQQIPETLKHWLSSSATCRMRTKICDNSVSSLVNEAYSSSNINEYISNLTT